MAIASSAWRPLLKKHLSSLSASCLMLSPSTSSRHGPASFPRSWPWPSRPPVLPATRPRDIRRRGIRAWGSQAFPPRILLRPSAALLQARFRPHPRPHPRRPAPVAEASRAVGAAAVEEAAGKKRRFLYGFLVISPMFATVSPFFIEGTPQI